MSIIYQKDKRSGLTYAYESFAYWDKDKKQSRAKRRLIGRVNVDTGEIVPTDGRCRQDKTVKTAKRGPVPATEMSRSFYGATYLLDAIGEKLGVTEDLKHCFPEHYKQMLSIAYFLILEDNNPLSRFDKWSQLHKHPYGKSISSQRGSDLFASITADARDKFFRMQGRHKAENEYWAYDITSISSYSEALRQVQYGANKENDRLPQLNLAVVFGEKSGLPFYYRKMAGNIPDSKTVKGLLADLIELGFTKVKLVMDRGFYSQANINSLFREHMKFLIAVRTNLTFVRKELDAIYDDFRSFESFNEEYEIYSRTVSTQWSYSQDRPYKGDTIEENRRIYLHLYYNIDKAAEDEKAFDRSLMALRRELESGKRIAEHESQYAKYFTIKTTPKCGIQITINEDSVKKAKRYYGYFALLSNEKMDSIKALELYRNKDVAEKAFGNLKERLNMRRMLVSSEQSLDGKLFVEFISLIYLSYIKKQMQDRGLFKSYTLQGVLDTLDLIECFEAPGRALRVGEILQKHYLLYEALDVSPPASL